jgi:hypothetical protein
MPGGKDLRRFKRIEVTSHRLNATLAIIEANRVTGCLVPVKDFSKGGAGVYVKFQVPPHTEIRLSLEGLNFAPLEGRIIWCGPSGSDPSAPATHPFRLGIDFTPKDDPARENQLAVYKYITKLAAGQGS